MIGFVLPDNLLKQYGINYIGKKYNAQPVLDRVIKKNINFIAGIINSDGTCYYSYKKNKKLKYERISICNITKSIIDDCCFCLDENNINFKIYKYDGSLDKRTGNISKSFYQIHILRKKSLEALRKKSFFIIKEPSNDLFAKGA